MRKPLEQGDLVILKDPAKRVMYGDGGYRIERVGRVNLRVSCDVRFSPTGPWFHQEHTVPIAHVVFVSPTYLHDDAPRADKVTREGAPP